MKNHTSYAQTLVENTARTTAFLLLTFLFIHPYAQGKSIHPISLLDEHNRLDLSCLAVDNYQIDVKGWNIRLDPELGPVFVDFAAPTDPSWLGLRDGLRGTIVNDMVIHGTDIYVGGYFGAEVTRPANGNWNNMGNIAKWDTQANTWTSLGGGVSGEVRALAIQGSNLYVGGSFRQAKSTQTSATNDITCNSIIRWDIDNQSWHTLKRGVHGHGAPVTVMSLAINDTYLYVGGTLSSGQNASSESPAVVYSNGIIRWSLSTEQWSAVSGDGQAFRQSGVSGPAAYTIRVFGDDIYVGGDFTSPSNDENLVLNHIAKYDEINNVFTPLNQGLEAPNAEVWDIEKHGNDLYIVGEFDGSAGEPTISSKNIVKWDINNRTWSAVGGDLPMLGGKPVPIRDVEIIDNQIYIAAGSPIEIRRLVNNNWELIDLNLNGKVEKILVYNDFIYVGGEFGGTRSYSPPSSVDANLVAKLGMPITEASTSPNLIEQTVATDQVQHNVRNFRLGQTFTTGGQAKTLTQIDVNTTGPLNGGFMIMDLYELNTSTNSLTYIASSNRGGYGGGVTTRLFQSSPSLQANTTYAFVLRNGGWNFFQVKGTNNGSSYTGGTAFEATNGGGNNDPQNVSYTPTDFDMWFKVHLQ